MVRKYWFEFLLETEILLSFVIHRLFWCREGFDGGHELIQETLIHVLDLAVWYQYYGLVEVIEARFKFVVLAGSLFCIFVEFVESLILVVVQGIYNCDRDQARSYNNSHLERQIFDKDECDARQQCYRSYQAQQSGECFDWFALLEEAFHDFEEKEQILKHQDIE